MKNYYLKFTRNLIDSNFTSPLLVGRQDFSLHVLSYCAQNPEQTGALRGGCGRGLTGNGRGIVKFSLPFQKSCIVFYSRSILSIPSLLLHCTVIE